jgi:hypothetical protein
LPAYCDGKKNTCPDNDFAKKDVECFTGTSNGGPCDDIDHCDGKGNCEDGFKDKKTVCEPGTPPCIEDGLCDGETGSCPGTTFADDKTKCDGTSQGGPCDKQDHCDGLGHCVDEYDDKKKCSNEEQCKSDSHCDGTSGQCTDVVNLPDTTVCEGTSKNGPCDGIDHCDGQGNCVDGFLDSTFLCFEGKTFCNPSYFCTGQDGDCPNPPDVFAYLEKDKVSMATYLQDTVTECSAAAVSVGSERLTAMYTSTGNSMILFVSCMAAIAVVASAMIASKQERHISMEDGYSRLSEDLT